MNDWVATLPRGLRVVEAGEKKRREKVRRVAVGVIPGVVYPSTEAPLIIALGHSDTMYVLPTVWLTS